jgi:hypothetical protein
MLSGHGATQRSFKLSDYMSDDYSYREGRTWVMPLSGVNYFFRLTTIISPEQRQLLSGAGDSPPLFAFLVS